MAKKHALLIGTSKFNDHRLNPLAAPLTDINELSELLKDKQFCGFDSVHSCLNSSLEEVRCSIEKLFSQRMKDDLILLYYSGHGIVDKRGRLYFALPNSNSSSPSAKSLDSNYIRQHMDDSNSSRQVLILDCCHSGAFGQNSKNLIGKDSGIVSINQSTFDPTGRGRFVLSSSAANERSFELEGKSIFTHTLINGVRNGFAAPDKDEILLDDLHHYLCKAVQETDAPMMPSYWTDKNAEPIIFSKNPKKIEPIDPAIIHALDSKDRFARIGAINNLEIIAIDNQYLRVSAIELLTQKENDGAERSDVSNAATMALKNIHRSIKPPEPIQPEIANAVNSVGNQEQNVKAEVQNNNQSVSKENSRSLAIPAAIVAASITFVTMILTSGEIDYLGCFDYGLIECGYLPMNAFVYLFLAVCNVVLLLKLKQPLSTCIGNSALFFFTAFFLLFLFDGITMLHLATSVPLALGLIALGCSAFVDYRNFRSIGTLLATSVGLSIVVDFLSISLLEIGFILLPVVIGVIFYVFYQNLTPKT